MNVDLIELSIAKNKRRHSQQNLWLFTDFSQQHVPWSSWEPWKLVQDLSLCLSRLHFLLHFFSV